MQRIWLRTVLLTLYTAYRLTEYLLDPGTLRRFRSDERVDARLCLH